jgi:DNA-binding response OmpR family regulator
METIVLQETDPDVLEVLYAALELGGFQVYALSDCDTGFLTLIDRARPHVVMLDYRLSGEQCIQYCGEIKKTLPAFTGIGFKL